jgi:hypothetical protein
MKRRVTSAVVAVFAIAALSGPAVAGAGDGPAAGKSADTLLRYITKGKLKADSRIEYRIVCTLDCNVTAISTLVLKGPNLSATSSGSFAAGQVIEVFVEPNRAARQAIKASGKSAQLKTKIRAIATATGETDSDARAYRFK